MGRGTSVLGTDKRKADLDAKGVHMSGELEKLILGDLFHADGRKDAE